MEAVLLVRMRGSEVGRQVDDQFSMHDEVIVRFFQVTSEHFCGKVSEGQPVWNHRAEPASSATYHHRPSEDR